MATVERLVDEISQLPAEERKRLLQILQRQVETSQSAAKQRSEPEGVSLAETVDLDSVDPELEWLTKNDWVLEKYRGEYLALKGSELIAHGTLAEVLAESERRGIHDPYTQYLPKTEREWLLGQGNYPINDS